MSLTPAAQTPDDRLAALEREQATIKQRLMLLEAAVRFGASGVITLPNLSDLGPYLRNPAVTPKGDYANVRSGPGRSHSILGQMVSGQEIAVVKVHLDTDGETAPDGHPFEWYELKSGGFVRQDVVTPMGSWDALKPPTSTGLYPCPVTYTSFGGFEMQGSHQHLGWDLAGPLGTPVYAAPFGGAVMASSLCLNCGEAGLSSYPEYPLNHVAVLNSPSWNYGYGHHIIMRYDHAVLPTSTQLWLKGQGWTGYHAFVMYAHLSRLLKGVAGDADPGQVIGHRGSSGNSSGPHLHLEVRFGSKTDTRWGNLRSGLADPGVLFSR